MNKLNHNNSVKETTTAVPTANIPEHIAKRFTAEELAERYAKICAEEEKEMLRDPIKASINKDGKEAIEKEKSVRKSENHKSNMKKKFDKNVETYAGRSNAYLLKRPVYVVQKEDVVLVGSSSLPELWAPSKEVDVEKAPTVLTHTKRMILERFVSNYRTVPEHFLIDHMNVQEIFDGTVCDEVVTVCMIIDDLYWNSFSERVPKEMRGFHVSAGPDGIRVIDNTGFHTLDMTVRMSLQFKSLDTSFTKKELLTSYKFLGGSLFLLFKTRNQELIKSHLREPTEPSFPIRIEDELTVHTRVLEDGEEVTKTGLILTPLAGFSSRFEELGVPLTENSDIDLEENMFNPFSSLSNSVDDKIEKAKEVADTLKEGMTIEVGASVDEKLDKLERITSGLTDALGSLHMKHSHEHSFSMKTFFQDTFDSVLDKLKFALPKDPAARDTVIILCIALIYLWAKKNLTKKYVYAGLALCTSISYWSDNTHVRNFCLTIFGMEAASDVVPLIMGWFTSEEEEDSLVEKDELVENGLGGIFDSMASDKFYSNSVLVNALIVGLFGVIIHTAPNPFWVISDIGLLGKVLNGAEMTYAMLTESVIAICNFATGIFGVKIFRNAYSKYPELYYLVDEMNALNTKFNEGRRVTLSDYDSFKKLMEIADRLWKTIPTSKEHSVYRQQLDYIMRLKIVLSDKFKISGVIAGGVRAAPYVYGFVGPSKLGKSVLSSASMDVLAPLILDRKAYAIYKEDPKSILVQVNPSNEYQEGVKAGHKLCIVDDFLQMANTNRDPKICHGNWLGRVVNNAEEVVNKAFSDKGTVFYEFDIMCLNTNVDDLEQDKLSTNNVNMVGRRMGDQFDVNIKDEYALKVGNKKMLDTSKVKGVDVRPYTFTPHSYLYNEDTMERLPTEIQGCFEWLDLMRVIAVRALSHRVAQEIMLANLAKAKSDPKLSPWAGEEGLAIIRHLLVEKQSFSYIVPVHPDLSASSALSILMGLELTDTEIELLTNEKYRLWIKLLSRCDQITIRYFLKSFTDPMLSGLTLHIEPLMELSEKDCLEELKVLHLRYSKKTLEEISKKEGIKPTSVSETFSYGKRRFLDFFKGQPQVEPLYDTDPNFFDAFLENRNKYQEWISGSSVPLSVDANIRIAGDRLANPMESLDLLYFSLRQTFVAIYSVGRRTATAPMDVLNAMVRAKSWKEFISDPYQIFKDHLSQGAVDMKQYGSDLFNAAAFAIPYSGDFMAVVAGAATVALGFVLSKDLELAANSILKVKFKPKMTKAKTKVVAKTAAAGPVVHAADLEKNSKIESTDITLVQNARFFNEELIAVENALIQNMYSLVFNGKIATQVVFLQDWSYIVNHHTTSKILEVADADAKYQLVDCHGSSHDCILGQSEFVHFDKELDLSLVTVNESKMGARPHIIDKHITAAELEAVLKMKKLSGVLMYFTKEGDTRKVYHIPVEFDIKFTKYEGRSSAMLIYTVEGHKSSCMSPLILCDDRFKGLVRVIGYHTAGNAKGTDSTGAAIVVTRELLREMMLEAPPRRVTKKSVVTLVTNSEVPYHIPIVGEQKPLRQAMMSKNKRTPFYGFAGPLEKYPAYSVPVEDEDGGIQFPLFNVLSTCNRDTPAVNDFICDMSRVLFEINWRRSIKNHRTPRVYTFAEAINGIDFLSPDSRKSSVGQELRHRGITKEMMYGKEGDRTIDTPLMQSLEVELAGQIEGCKNSIRPDWKYMGFIKSELRSPKKFKDGIMRLIMGTDWFQLIASKMYFGFLVSTATENSLRNGCAMGMNPYSTDVDVMATMLSTFNLLCDGDYNEFDKRFFRWIIHQFKKFCRTVYYNAPEEDHIVRDVILDCLAEPYLVVNVTVEKDPENVSPDSPVSIKAFILLLRDILASGDLLTQMLGSFGDHVMINYTFLMKWCESHGINHIAYNPSIHPKPDLEREADNMHNIVLADDNIVALREERYDFCCLTIPDLMAEIGAKYTPADKTDRYTVKWRKLNEIQFLRRMITYSKEQGRHLMPIELASILGALYYSETGMKNFDQVLDTMLQELAIKGRDVHKCVVELLLAWAADISYTITSPYLDYDIAIAFVLNTTYMPWGEKSIPLYDSEDLVA